ncbi:MAG: heavy metal translocating P-type ATPase metal-binding domain-containing protein [Ignavibacteriae bacterium]|nr:heavy metal translocating P-type ATPase metal-binding domain-containing protein [Ignavibacteriota bacterium]
MSNEKAYINEKIICYHCGDICKDKTISKEEKYFCCQGCKIVFEILEDNKLCKYYDFETTPGISPSIRNETKYLYLDDEATAKQILDFSDGNIGTVTFHISQMHCSSCIWLLENINRLNKGVISSRVNFLQKKLSLKFLNDKTSLKQIAELLDSIGYEPLINFESVEKKKRSNYDKKLYYKIGVAGFAAGNIMLFSFPEYFGLDRTLDSMFGNFFGYLNLLISIPVLLYSASVYYIPAIKGLRKKVVNIDFPISLGIFVLFFRSAYEILTQTGAGYSDSMAMLVFLLLIGKIFQNKTYDALNFERTYKSYFPLSVAVVKSGIETTIPLSKLKKGDRIIVRNGELIPADSILFKGDGNIDYSFVTGESTPVNKVLGEIVYAGGKQYGEAIELEVLKDVSQSYLTQLWNNDTFTKKEEQSVSWFSNNIGKYFTIVVLLIANISTIIWLNINPGIALSVFTAVLIVACPCAIALAIPFTLGNALRNFGKEKFYLKNINTIERLAKIDTIVFDKTGTITQSGNSTVNFVGETLDNISKSLIKSISRHSTHPLSRRIYLEYQNCEHFEISNLKEIRGKGITGYVLNSKVSLGSFSFVTGNNEVDKFSDEDKSSKVYYSINDRLLGVFLINNSYREGLDKVVSELERHYDLHLLSGDNENEKYNLSQIFRKTTPMHFKQSPEDKLKYLLHLQAEGKRVLMIGDGLNDAGAIKQSDVGISISEDISGFSPSCDGILDSENFSKLPKLISYSKMSMKIIYISFIFSVLYNIIGLYFAVNGFLSPLFAAVLMPVSSVSVVLFCVLASNFMAKKKLWKKQIKNK